MVQAEFAETAQQVPLESKGELEGGQGAGGWRVGQRLRNLGSAASTQVFSPLSSMRSSFAGTSDNPCISDEVFGSQKKKFTLLQRLASSMRLLVLQRWTRDQPIKGQLALYRLNLMH